MILPVYCEPQPVLRAVTEPVTEFGPALAELAQSMRETMHGADGLGIAAPQIGKSLALFVTEFDEKDTDSEDRIPYTVFANPEIVWRSSQKTVMEEACLSIPGVAGNVKRPKKITVRYQDVDGKQRERTFEGFFARVIQHEYDHLKGILFTDYVPEERRITRKAPNYPRI
jgi:peptide deformylase